MISSGTSTATPCAVCVSRDGGFYRRYHREACGLTIEYAISLLHPRESNGLEPGDSCPVPGGPRNNAVFMFRMKVSVARIKTRLLFHLPC